jgi:hypothetical protein
MPAAIWFVPQKILIGYLPFCRLFFKINKYLTRFSAKKAYNSLGTRYA